MKNNCLQLITAFILMLIISNDINAQEKKGTPKRENEKKFESKSSLGIVLGHAHVFQGRDELGKKKSLVLPSIGIDYMYQLKPQWSIGLQTDIIIENFKVEKHLGSGEVIERSKPIAPAFMGMYKASEHWNFLFGAGAEFAKEDNFFLNRFGVEYAAELPNEWEVFGTLSYDLKWKAYDTWVLGIGIAKKFGK
jgi:hypothetical protein